MSPWCPARVVSAAAVIAIGSRTTRKRNYKLLVYEKGGAARGDSRTPVARASAADPRRRAQAQRTRTQLQVRWRVRLVAQTLLTQCEASNCRRRAFTVKPPRRRTIRTPQPHSASKLSHGPVRRPTGRRGSVHDRTDLPPGCGDTHQTITDWNSSAPQDSRHQASGNE